MLWHAMPPELNTARLMAGAGPAPMLQAEVAWTTLSAALEAQADQLAAILTSLGTAWTGVSGERAVAAAAPMVAWLRAAALQTQKRGLQAAAQATAYTTAMAMTPSLPEIATNHMTRAVLLATNFLGINMVPIGLNETDYFVRMWNQAAAAMDAYQAETAVNTTFEPLPPPQPIVVPDSGAAAEGATSGRLAELAGKAADPLTLAKLAAHTGEAAPFEGLPVGEALIPFVNQMSAQLGQAGGPIQQLTQLLQQASSMGGPGVDRLGEPGEHDSPQLGLLGASPFSTHPLAGGSGPSSGAGLMRADTMPGAAGSPPRTPLLSQLLDRPMAPAAVGATGAATAGASAGVSAVGGGAPVGGAPIGAMAAQGIHGNNRPAMAMPTVLAPDTDEDERAEPDLGEDDW